MFPRRPAFTVRIMNRNPRRATNPGALETIETAVHLLRIAPAGTLAAYHLAARRLGVAVALVQAVTWVVFRGSAN